MLGSDRVDGRGTASVGRIPASQAPRARARQPEKFGKPGQGGGGVTINVVFESVDVKEQLKATEVKELMPVETVEEGEDAEHEDE